MSFKISFIEQEFKMILYSLYFLYFIKDIQGIDLSSLKVTVKLKNFRYIYNYSIPLTSRSPKTYTYNFIHLFF